MSHGTARSARRTSPAGQSSQERIAGRNTSHAWLVRSGRMYGPRENAVVRGQAFVTKRAILLWLLTAALGWAQQSARQGVIQVNVDARDAPRRLIHVQLHIPA